MKPKRPPLSLALFCTTLPALAAGFAGGCLVPPSVMAADPVISNVVASQRPGTKLVDITYDASDADGGALEISVEISGDGGSTYLVPANALSEGATANSYPSVVFPVGVTSLTGRTIVWDAGTDFNQQFNSQMVVRVIAGDGPPPPGMVLIPAGSFDMGDSTGAGLSQEAPVHAVAVNGFYMDKVEVTEQLWDQVRAWALANGYPAGSLTDRGTGKGPKYPAQGMNWYEAVLWCNARSEMEQLNPVYFTNSTQTIVYRSAQIDLDEASVDWSANGYRLPTEAEWEKAARGGLAGKSFPWGGASVNEALDINDGNANFFNSGDPETGTGFETTPTGYYTPNGYGLGDMAGNVWEWCWDAHSSSWYTAYPPASWPADPRGPAFSGARVQRGGSWSNSNFTNFSSLRCSVRGNTGPQNDSPSYGFRCVRGL